MECWITEEEQGNGRATDMLSNANRIMKTEDESAAKRHIAAHTEHTTTEVKQT